MVFESFESLKNTAEHNIDIMETNPFTYYKYKLKDTFLNIKDYLAFDNDPKHIALFDNQLIASYYQTFFVFYNSDFLRKNNLPEPAFKNFDEQRKYFNLLNDKSEKFDIDFFMGACVPPIIYLGKYFNDLINFLNTNVGSSEKENLFEQILNQTLEFCSLFDYKSHSPKDKSMNIHFEEGSMPFLTGSSGDYWRLLSMDIPFKWKAYPLFSIDNLCIKHPIYTGIIKKTEDPLNAFQFLSFLLDDKVQQKFTEIGLIPVNLDLFNIECLTKEQNKFFKECYKKVELLKLTSYPQFYVQNFIFSPQLLEKAMNHKKQNYNLKRIFHLARTYFASHHA